MNINCLFDGTATLRRASSQSLAVLGLLLLSCTANAQTVLPTDAAPKCIVEPDEFAKWFKSGSVASNGRVLPADGVAMNTQSRAEFDANWDRQVGCPDQYDPAASQSVWSNMILSDPVGATWGTGVRRAPQTTSWGWTHDVVAKTTIPTLMISGAHDKQVATERVRELYADLGSPQKVFIDLACSSHNAMWERNHLLLFKASLDWLRDGKVNGTSQGIVKLGY